MTHDFILGIELYVLCQHLIWIAQHKSDIFIKGCHSPSRSMAHSHGPWPTVTVHGPRSRSMKMAGDVKEVLWVDDAFPESFAVFGM